MLPPPPFALFDDNLSDAGDLLLHGLQQTLRCHAVDEIAATFAAIDAARREGLWVAIAIDYEFGHLLEARLRACARPSPGARPLLTAWVFSHAHRQDAARTSADFDRAVSTLDEHEALAGVCDLHPGLGEEAYHAAVERVRALIHAGDCYQVNYTFPCHGRAYGSTTALYRRLRNAQPVRYGAWVHDGSEQILSRSPELFVERHGRQLRCRPMKGTAARNRPAHELSASAKNRAENVMIVDLIRNDLGRLAPAGGVRVEALCEVEAYPSVWQMTSTVSAAPVDADLLDILCALFPCGSVTGAPRIRAMEIIRELEENARGLYCGALGWLAPDGDFRFSVPIRTIVIDAADNATLGVGSGIVADSTAAEEWRECLLKARFLREAGGGFGLIETLRCEPASATPYGLLERHLHRLRQSARCFGFELQEAALRAALAQIATTAHAEVLRVRIEVHADGQFDLASTPLGETPEGATVTLNDSVLDSGDLLLRHKTTARTLYDRALAEAMEKGHFDTLFFNERGELCEGARSSVFVDIDGTLCTPPLHCGLLDGVWRRLMLDEGRARERVLHRADLAAARAVFVGNALRGMTQVQVVDA